jgi:hypothetical protein
MISYIANIYIHSDYGCYGFDSSTLEFNVKASSISFMLCIKHRFTIIRRLRKYYSDNSNASITQFFLPDSTEELDIFIQPMFLLIDKPS